MKENKGSKKMLALLIASALSAGNGSAFAAGMTAAEDLEDLPSYSLGEVVVTATRTQKRDVDVPAATTVITADEIKESGAASAADVLEQENGFIYKAFGPNGAAMGTMSNEVNVRGFKGGMLILMNGNPISWRGKYNLDAIPAGSIERIEIVKGSGSVLYGSEAMSGVVNIITKKGAANKVYAGFGSHGQQTYGVSVGDERFGIYYNYDKWGRRNRATYSDVDVRNFWGETRTDLRDIEKRNVGVSYRISPHLSFLLNYYDTEATYRRTITQVMRSAQRLHVGEPYNARTYETQRYITQLNYSDRNFKGSLYFNTGTTEATGPVYISKVGRRTPEGWYNTREKNTTYGMDLQRTWQMNKATAIFGAHLEHEGYSSLPAHDTAQGKYYARNNWGVFGQWEQRFDKRNTGIFGLRETWTSGAMKHQNYNNLSAAAQWLHKLDSDTSLYLNISQSFIMPTFAQMYKDNSMQIPSPNLKPQTGINYEIGWKKTHGAHAWKAALFHMYIKDNITATLNKARTEYKYTNEDFRNTGFELSDEIQGKHGFSYNWGVTWQNPETRSTEKEVGWERTFGKVQLTGGVTYKKGKWASTLTGSYLAGRVQSPSNAPAYRSKPYLLTSWNTSYAPDEHSEFSLRIDNVLNRDDVTTHTGSDYYVSPTSFLLRYGYKF